MSWAKFSDDAHRSERILELSLPARWLWAAAIMDNRGYTVPGCARGRSPFISKVRAEALARQQGAPLKAIAELAKAGRWEPTEGGWNIHDFGDFLPDHEFTKDRARAAGLRSAEARRQKYGSAVPINGPNTDRTEGSAERDRTSTEPDVREVFGRTGPNPARVDPVPVPVPVTDNSPPHPPLRRSDELKKNEQDDLGLQLAVRAGQLLKRELSASEIHECGRFMDEFAYLDVDMAIERMTEHLAICSARKLRLPETVQGFRHTLQERNDWLSDHRAPKAWRPAGSVSGFTRLGDQLKAANS